MARENFGWFYTKAPIGGNETTGQIYSMRSLGAVPPIGQGEILVRLHAIAVLPNARSYLELPGNASGSEDLGLHRTKIGELAPCEYVAEVLESRSNRYKMGERIRGYDNMTLYKVFRDDGKDSPFGRPPSKILSKVPSEKLLSVITPSAGITSYVAIEHHICGRVDQPCHEKTVLVTSAAGAVGLVAGQLYKNKGCRVIGVTSTRAKGDKLAEFGFDATIAYRTENMDERLKELAPNGVDIFFDNVGAEQLDAGTRHMNVLGKILSIGAIAEYDEGFSTGQVKGYKEYMRMAARELTFGGFLMYNHLDRLREAERALEKLMEEGRLKSEETVVQGHFEDWASCVDQVMTGNTFGRMILKLGGEQPSRL